MLWTAILGSLQIFLTSKKLGELASSPCSVTWMNTGRWDDVKKSVLCLSTFSSFHFMPYFKTTTCQRSSVALLLQMLKLGKTSLGEGFTDFRRFAVFGKVNLPMTLSSALAKMMPCLFSATHWYMPASDRLTFVIVSEPCSSWTLPCRKRQNK